MSNIPLTNRSCNHNPISAPEGEKWTRKVQRAKEMGERLQRIGYTTRGLNIMACGQEIDYRYCPECGTYEVINTSLCRDRMCPLCNWRLGLKRYAEMMQVMDELLPLIKAGHTVGMITLTVRNVPLDKLSDELDAMAIGYKRMVQRSAWRKQILGYARNLEITYNEQENTYHPHYHVLVICQQGIEPATAVLTIARVWGESLRADYIPICHGAEAYSNVQGELVKGDLTGAIIECSKYATKPGLTDNISDNDLAQYMSILAGRQIVSYGGLISDTRKRLRITDRRAEMDPSGSTMSIKQICECGAEMQGVIAKWAGGKQWEHIGCE